MRRLIAGFHRDVEGDWVAELSCLHNQHVRHRPPFFDRPWVLTDDGRDSRIGTPIDCPLCDRAELPADLVVARTAGPFDEQSMPDGLRRDHRVADATWGRLRVLDGSVHVVVRTDPIIDRRVDAADEQPLPPGVAHHVEPDAGARFAIDFLVTAAPAR